LDRGGWWIFSPRAVEVADHQVGRVTRISGHAWGADRVPLGPNLRIRFPPAGLAGLPLTEEMSEGDGTGAAAKGSPRRRLRAELVARTGATVPQGRLESTRAAFRRCPYGGKIGRDRSLQRRSG
jgi:hypothetical protein